jgi:hypothetical protein
MGNTTSASPEDVIRSGVVKVLPAMGLGLALLGVSCGSGPNAPSVAQVDGRWTGTSTLTSITGEECVAEQINNLVGVTVPFSLVFSQIASNVTETSFATTPECFFTGTVGTSTIALRATSASCHDLLRGFPCRGNAGSRDIGLIERTLSGTIAANKMSLTLIQRENVFIAGTPMLVGVVTTTNDITLSR